MRWSEGYIAVDWGTTNRRAYRLDGDGLSRRRVRGRDRGPVRCPQGGFPAAVAEIRDRLGDYPMLLAGMIGSNRGWREAPYVPAPPASTILSGRWCGPGEREAIVPGRILLENGRADVMRGEEVQLLGAIGNGSIGADGMACHPGTHNKWVTLRGGKIDSFRTVMTGELFSLLKEHGILSDLLQGEVDMNDVFRDAARHAIDNESAARRPVFGPGPGAARLGRKEDAATYASGLLIGADVRVGLSCPLRPRSR